MTESILNSFIDLIHNSLDDNPEIKKAAQDQLTQIEESQPLELFQNCAAIINSDDHPKIDRSIYNMALSLLTRLLDYSKHGQTLFDFWQNLTEEVKTDVRTAAIRSILCEDKEISNIGYTFFARLFNIDLGDLKAGAYLHEFLSNNKGYNETHRLNAIRSISSLVSPENLTQDELHAKQIHEEIHQFEDDLLIFMENISSYSSEFSVELLHSIGAVISNAEDFIKEEDGEAFVQRILSILPTLFPICEDANIFESLYQLYCTIIVSTYDIDKYDSIITNEEVVSLGENGLTCTGDFLRKVLMFWIELLTWEKRRKDTNDQNARFCATYANKIKSPPTFLKMPPILPYKSIGELAAERITKPILEFATILDETSTDPEDPEDPEDCMYACNILERLFNFHPDLVYNEVKAFWEQTENTESWTLQHARCIIPHIFCKNPKITLPGLRDFVLGTVSYIGPFLSNPETILRIVESGFYTLYLIEKRYENIRDFDQLTTIFEAISAQQARHRTIAIRCLALLNEIIKKSKSVSKDFNAKLEEPIFNIIAEILSVDNYSEDEELIRSCYMTLFLYIKESADDIFDSMKDRITQIVTDISTLATQALDTVTNMSLHHTLIQTKLWLLTAIFRRFHVRLEQYSINVANTLFEVMAQPATENLHEEILMCLFDIILAVPKENEDVKNKILEYMPRSLDSGDPSLAQTAITALSFIFQRYQENVIDTLDDALTAIFNLLDDETFPADYKPKLLFALGRILKSVTRNLSSELRHKLFEQIDGYIKLDFDTSSLEDILFLNEIFASVYSCYSGILEGMSPEDINFMAPRQFFKNLINPLKKLAQLRPITNETIWCLAMFFDKAIQVFGRQGNIFLNYHSNFFICVWGIVSDDISLQEYCKRTLKRLQES